MSCQRRGPRHRADAAAQRRDQRDQSAQPSLTVWSDPEGGDVVVVTELDARGWWLRNQAGEDDDHRTYPVLQIVQPFPED